MKLERRDLLGIARALKPVVERVLRTSLADIHLRSERTRWQPQGIRVVTPEAVSKKLGRSVRQLRRLEDKGELPRRRKIGRRRTGYYEHELEGIPIQAVKILDGRKLTRQQLAEKLRVHERTLARLEEEMPEPVDGSWFERDIDDWLLTRPLA